MLSTLKVDEKWLSSWPCIYIIIKIKAGRDTALNNLKLKLCLVNIGKVKTCSLYEFVKLNIAWGKQRAKLACQVKI